MTQQAQYYCIGIIGVRDFKGTLYTNNDYVIDTLVKHIVKNVDSEVKFTFVTGGGKGVESMIIDWAKEHQIECRKIPPNIREFGPQNAFSMRNNNIVTQCDELIVFWDGCIDTVQEAVATAMRTGKRATIFPLV